MNNMQETDQEIKHADSRRDALVTSRVLLGDGALDLRCGDCMDLMRETPDQHFDLAIVDPPYGIGINSSGRLGHYGGKGKTWDANIPSVEYFAELWRVSKARIIWGGNYFPLPPSRCFLIWDKQQPAGVSFADAEMAWTSFDASAKTFRMRPQKADDNRIHPTQKPVALYNWVLANYATKGMHILDTHLGSGNIAIACHYAGMRLTATEIDPEYFVASVERIKRETRQQTLFT